MKIRKLMAASLTVALVMALGGTAVAGWWDKADDAKPVDLRRVLDDPGAFKGKEITFDCVFHEISTIYNPYYTRFIPSQYVNFAVWPAGQHLWRERDYLNSFSFLFLERAHKSYQQLVGTKKYTRLRLHGYVQNTFKNVPWIEVRHIEVLDGALTTGSLREIIRGDELAEAGRWAEAAEHWSAATAMDLPPAVLAEIHVKRGEAFLNLGRTADAKAVLAQVLEADPENDRAQSLLAKIDPTYAPPPTDEPPMAETPAKPTGPVAKPVDPKRFEEPPKAMPVPGAEPVPTKPGEETGSEPQPVAPAKPPVVGPEMEEAPAAPAEPTKPADPGAEVEPETGPTAPAKPEGESAEPKPEQKKDPLPEKQLSGPM